LDGEIFFVTDASQSLHMAGCILAFETENHLVKKKVVNFQKRLRRPIWRNSPLLQPNFPTGY